MCVCGGGRCECYIRVWGIGALCVCVCVCVCVYRSTICKSLVCVHRYMYIYNKHGKLMFQIGN